MQQGLRFGAAGTHGLRSGHTGKECSAGGKDSGSEEQQQTEGGKGQTASPQSKPQDISRVRQNEAFTDCAPVPLAVLLPPLPQLHLPWLVPPYLDNHSD